MDMDSQAKTASPNQMFLIERTPLIDARKAIYVQSNLFRLGVGSCFLDQLHAENPGVEIEILLRRSGNRRDVVQTVSTVRCPLLRHDLSPS